MKKSIVFITIFFLNIYPTFSQSRGEEYFEYERILHKPISNDSLTSYIFKYQEKLKEATASNNKFLKAKYNLFLGQLYYRINMIDIAQEHTDSIFNTLLKTDTIYAIYSLKLISNIYSDIEKDSLTYPIIKLNLKLSTLINDTSFISSANMALGVYYKKNKKKDSSIYYLDKGFEFAKANNDTLNIIKAYNNYAYIYYHNKDYNLAVSTMKKSIEYLKKMNIDHNKAPTFFKSFSIILAYKHDFEEAYKYALLAYKMARKKNYESTPNDILVPLIAIAMEMEKWKEAEQFFFDLINLRQKSKIQRNKLFFEKIKLVKHAAKLGYDNKLLNIEMNYEKEKVSSLRTKLWLILSFFLISVGFIIYILFQNKKLKKAYKKIVKNNIDIICLEEEMKELENNTFTKSKTKEENNKNIDNEVLWEQIIDLFENKDYFLDPNININKTAEELNSNRAYISTVINSKTKKCFNDFVNKYRIERVKYLLMDKKNYSLTVQSIGEMAGFSSNSTFYRVFKNETGVTPAFYMKNIKNIT